jgi:hypothetical protein
MNYKHLVIVILLILIVFLLVLIYKKGVREQFQYNNNERETKVRRCSESITQLANIVESLKAVNLPPEIAQEIAMSIITEDPQDQVRVQAIIRDLDIDEAEKQELNNIVLNNKGIVSSLQDKQAFISYDTIYKNLDMYQNDVLYHLNKNN